MTIVSNCITNEELENLLSEEVSSEWATEVRAHLDSCSDCSKALEKLESIFKTHHLDLNRFNAIKLYSPLSMNTDYTPMHFCRQGKMKDADFSNRMPSFSLDNEWSKPSYLMESTTAISSIENELLVAPQRRFEVEFFNSKPQTKTIDGNTFQLQRLNSFAQGINVQMAFPETRLMKKATNMFERFHASVLARNCYSLWLEDRNGKTYQPNVIDSGNRVAENDHGFGFCGKSLTWADGSNEQSLSSISFFFRPLPKGIRIRRIVAAMTELDEADEIVPRPMEALTA